jgi:lipoate-protein ligase A
MAVDEAILEAVSSGDSPPTLRFYAWHPPCLSLGYSQAVRDEVDLEACRARGIDLVRRPTGGRAILHTDELTYSVVVPQSDPRVAGEIVESYRRLCQGLLAGLRMLGLEVMQAGRKPSKPETFSTACFDAPSDYELIVGGRKIVGSAQARRHGVVLQHGALPLVGDITRIVDVLNLPEDEREEFRAALRMRATTLEAALGRALSFDEVVRALAHGFAQALNLELVPGELSPSELARAEMLRAEKYAAEGWTFQKEKWSFLRSKDFRRSAVSGVTSMTIPVEMAERDLRQLLENLRLGETITLVSSEGQPLAVVVSLKSSSVEVKPVSDWETRWDELVRGVSRAWKSDKSAVELLTEMRR